MNTVAGLTYQPDFISAEEETALLAELEALTFQEVRMHGVAARRTVIHYGYDYDYDGWSIRPTDPPPSFLEPLMERGASAASISRETLEQVLVARYPPGATIGWHRDAPMFGSPVIGISIGSPCTMRFRRKAGEKWERLSLTLEARSLYILDGAARTQWQHSIPPTPSLRYSITFRSVRRR